MKLPTITSSAATSSLSGTVRPSILAVWCATREIAEAGGLMSYGPNIADAWRQSYPTRPV
jgi:hypothetical protein